MVVARGFENYFLKETEERKGPITLIGHNYDQDVAEHTELRKIFQGIGKKVIIVTHINPACRKLSYERAVMSACQSQFQDGILEIEAEQNGKRES